MYATVMNEKAVRGPVAALAAITRNRIPSAPNARIDGGQAAPGRGGFLAALRRQFRRAALARQLMALDDRLLADIGIERWQISEIADRVAAQTGAGMEPQAQTVTRFLRERILAPIRRAHQRRVAYRELSALDDRMLRDIGLTRGDIPAVVQALSDETVRRGRLAAGAEEQDMLWSLRLWNRSRSAAKALYALDDRMLSDIGLVRGDVDGVATELAKRSLRRPANRNVAVEPEAA